MHLAHFTMHNYRRVFQIRQTWERGLRTANAKPDSVLRRDLRFSQHLQILSWMESWETSIFCQYNQNPSRKSNNAQPEYNKVKSYLRHSSAELYFCTVVARIHLLRAESGAAALPFPDLKCHLSCGALPMLAPTFQCDILTGAVSSVDTRSDWYWWSNIQTLWWYAGYSRLWVTVKQKQ